MEARYCSHGVRKPLHCAPCEEALAKPGGTYEGDVAFARDGIEKLRAAGHADQAEAIRILLNELDGSRAGYAILRKKIKALAGDC